MIYNNNMIKRYSLVIGAMVLLSACGEREQTQTTEQITPAVDTPRDTHTQSNADRIKIEHLDLDIKVSFEDKTISGIATWQIDNTANKEDSLKLDTYDLTIDSIWVGRTNTPFTLGPEVPHLGRVLSIPITEKTDVISIWYKSGKNARALQWLDPQQTMGKKHPFLYTQSESIYARSWIPCPDGPGIRFTYRSRVRVPKGLMALMSAENPQEKNDTGVYRFAMKIPIPAYLMALAVGDITFKAIDERTGVYAEPNMIDKAHNEFADVGKMVTSAEKLYGEYRWGRYDILVLPPGFPIGGMENPKLTFCTPTIIAGDRSLVNLIAHELAHSWSGNLVTNATWNDFWLNEGFTVYFERRLTESMTDKSYADMLWELGYQDLQAAVADLGEDHKDTHLKLDLTGRDPDEGLTDIAYEKGAHFLKLIENTVGREKMDAFLKGYFNTYAFKTIHTEAFLAYLDKELIKVDADLRKKLNIKAWVYGPGIPPNCPRADQARFKKVDEQRAAFLKGTAPAQLVTTQWTTHEWLHFLRKMPKPLTMAQMQSLDEAYKFTTSGNSEIANLWYVMAVNAGYEKAYPAIDEFLSRVGRRKFLQPLYEAMMESGKQEMAKSIYKKYRGNYHPLAQGTLDKLINGQAT